MMVQVSVSADVSVTGGPTLPLELVLDPDAYVVSEALLAPQGRAGAEVTVGLVPPDVVLTFLAVSAAGPTGSPAVVRVVPAHADETGPVLNVLGSLLMANADVVAGLVPGGPLGLILANLEATTVTVRVLAAFEEIG
ncbi:hypothetical protein ACNHYB_03185 [Isoptericola jiangsuensis]|uniref:hypothetical protein n=1 Tax=Isoptericola jiangsuensis TaxID=548579 RepID=UPI003AAB10C9